MDIMNEVKEYVENAVGKLKKDPGLMEDFKKDPVKTIEKTLNIDLPDEKLKTVADAVKAKLTADKIGSAADSLKGLFGKK